MNAVFFKYGILHVVGLALGINLIIKLECLNTENFSLMLKLVYIIIVFLEHEKLIYNHLRTRNIVTLELQLFAQYNISKSVSLYKVPVYKFIFVVCEALVG